MGLGKLQFSRMSPSSTRWSRREWQKTHTYTHTHSLSLSFWSPFICMLAPSNPRLFLFSPAEVRKTLSFCWCHSSTRHRVHEGFIPLFGTSVVWFLFSAKNRSRRGAGGGGTRVEMRFPGAIWSEFASKRVEMRVSKPKRRTSQSSGSEVRLTKAKRRRE